MLEHNVTQLH